MPVQQIAAYLYTLITIQAALAVLKPSRSSVCRPGGAGVGLPGTRLSSSPVRAFARYISTVGSLSFIEGAGGGVVKQVLALAVVLAVNTGDSSCQTATTAKACQIDTRGIRVENGLVTDVITVTCDPIPRTHRLDGWVEYRETSDEKWQMVGVKRTDHTRPDAEGFQMPVNGGHCVPGDYRTAWQATGIGPDPAERPFDYRDGDFWATTVDCEEG